MKWTYIILGGIAILAAWQIGLADSITTSIACDGATFLTTAIIGPEETYSNVLFTDSQANLTRVVDRGKEIETTSRITGSGAFGVDEFIGKERIPELDNRYCVFVGKSNKSDYNSVATTGLFWSGSYLGKKRLGNGSTLSRTAINGTGMVLITSRGDDGNTSTNAKTFAAGPMELSEEVRLGGDTDV